MHDIADVRLELEESLSAPPRETSRANWLVLVPAVVLTALVTWLLLRPTPAPVDVKHFSINLAPGDEFIVGGIEGPLVTISPDGSKVVYAGLRDGVSQLFLRRIDEVEATPIPGTRDARTPFFSPDGESLGFTRDFWLERVALGGGPPTMLGKNNNFGGSWSRNGRIVFPSVEGTFHVPADGGSATEVSFDGDRSVVWPSVLPDGRTVLFGSAPQGLSNIVSVSLETGEARVLIENGNYPRYAASGHLVFARGDTVFAAPFDAERGDVTGAAVPVLTGVSRGGSGEASFDVSEDGTLVYVAELRKPESGLVWVDRRGEPRPVGPRRRASWSSPRVSPNGELIAAVLEPLLGVPDVWLLDTGAETLTRLTSSGALSPLWEPAGNSLLFSFYNKLSRQSIDSAEADTLGVDCDDIMSISVTGEFVLCEANDRNDIELVRLEEGGEREPLLDSQFNEHSGALSPDERWLAFVSDESGEDEVYLQPFPGPGRKRRVSTDGGSQLVWSRDGRELFYRNALNMNAVTVSEEGVPGEPELLFSGNFESTFERDPQYDVSVDGQRFLMIERAPRDERPEIHVVLNWFEELKRLAP